MPITPNSTVATQGPLPPMFSPGAMGGGIGFPGMGMGVPQFQGQALPQGLSPNFQSIQQLLQQQPMSQTNALIPGLAQILGIQTQQMLPMLQQQAGSLEAAAQSDAMRRGLTGSSIEAASLLGARSAGQQNVNQFLAQQLGQLGQAYTGAVGADVGAQNQAVQNMAQALGQQMQSQIQQQQFDRMLQEGLAQAQMMANAQQQGALYGALGQGLGALGSGAMLAFSDIRLKENIERIGEYGGLGVYAFSYKPGHGLPSGSFVGFMAHEVEEMVPGAVTTSRDGYKMVDYAWVLSEVNPDA